MSPIITGPSDWAVPHGSRLKYRQQFNGLDKLMTGYLTGMACVHVIAWYDFVVDSKKLKKNLAT